MTDITHEQFEKLIGAYRTAVLDLEFSSFYGKVERSHEEWIAYCALTDAYDALLECVVNLRKDIAYLQIANEKYNATRNELKSCMDNEKFLADNLNKAYVRIKALEAERDHWRNLVNDLEHNSIYLDSKAYYEGRIAELESAIALSISDIDLSRADSARDRLFEVVKLYETEES